MAHQISRRAALRVALATGAGVGLGTGLVGAGAANAGHDDATDAAAPTTLERTERDRLLAVISKTEAIEPRDYEPEDLVTFADSEYQVRAEVAEQLQAMFDAAAREEVELRIISGYRSFTTQAETYDYWVRRYGRSAADRSSARAGHSEHQSGLAVDLDDTNGDCYLDECFGRTDAGEWLQRNAHRYGFIKSYPEDGRDRTGFIHEPWHWRYVGPQAAGDMYRLEIELLQDYVERERSMWIGLWIGRNQIGSEG